MRVSTGSDSYQRSKPAETKSKFKDKVNLVPRFSCEVMTGSRTHQNRFKELKNRFLLYTWIMIENSFDAFYA